MLSLHRPQPKGQLGEERFTTGLADEQECSYLKGEINVKIQDSFIKYNANSAFSSFVINLTMTFSL